MDVTNIIQTIFSEYGLLGAGIIALALYFKNINDRVMNESKEREEKLMAQNEQRELRFIDTINNITQDVSNRMDNIESDVTNIKTDINEIKIAVAPKA